MAVSAFTVANLKPALSIDSGVQRFIFGLPEAPEPLAAFKLDSIFVPVSGTPSQMDLETRNNALFGFRWRHETYDTDTYGSYILQRFNSSYSVVTDILSVANDGTLSFLRPISGDLNMGSHKIINVLDPTNAQDAATKAYVDSAIDNNFGPNVALPFLQLNWNWANPGSIGIYRFTHKLNDAFTSKQMVTEIVADDNLPGSARRYWTQLWSIASSTPGVSDYGTHSLSFVPSAASGAATFSVYSVTLNTSTGSSFNFAMPVNMATLKITNLGNPTNAQDGATKNYVDTSTVTLTGSVTGSGSVNSSFATAFANSQTVSGTTQTFNYSPVSASSIFSIQNTNTNALTVFRAGTSTDYLESGYDGSTDYSYFNLVGAANSKFVFRSAGTGIAALLSTGIMGLGTITPTVAKFVVSGGVATVASEDSSIRVTGSSNATKIELENTTANAGKLYEFRSDNAGACSIFDRTAVASRLFINSAGRVGVNTTSPTTAQLVVSGGVLNVGSEESGLRVISSSPSAKIELQCTNGSGRLLEFHSDSNGGFNVYDRVGNVSRMYINTSGQVGFGNIFTPHAQLQFPNVITNRQMVFWEGANNNFQFHGFGSITGGFGYNIVATGDSHVFFAGASSSSRNELARIQGDGNVSIGVTSTTSLARLYVNGGVANVASEDTCIRVTGSSNATKIELNNTTANAGKNFELRSTNVGDFAIFDRTAGTLRLCILSGGNVGIGTNAPDNLLSVNGTANKSGGGTWGSFSDSRIKDVLGVYAHGLNEILQINPIVYKYNDLSQLPTKEQEIERVGVVAQDIENILPECVELRNTKGFSDLRYYDSSAIMYALINAVKELNIKIESLEERL